MATKKKLLQAAAGQAGGEALNVEDVFSTYLYEGNGTGQAIENGINLGQSYGSGSIRLNKGYINLSSTSVITGDFTIETWAFIQDLPWTYGCFIGSTLASGYNFQFSVDPSNRLRMYNNSIEILGSTTSNQVPLGQWTHLAVTRSSGTHYFFVDGVLKGTTTAGSTTTYRFDQIGAVLDSYYVMQGYMSGTRIVNGTALYTSNFTPPTSHLTAVTNTDFLFGQGDTPLVDESTNSVSTSNFGTTASIFGPFDPAEAGEGGAVWFKGRTGSYNHILYDTERGALEVLRPNRTDSSSQLFGTNGLTAFNTDGFSITGGNGELNYSGQDYASWTFRKAPRFFDCVTYTGDGTSGRTISHNLGCEVGCIITKRLNSSVNNWSVYHRKANPTSPQNVYLTLNNTDAATGSTAYWNNTAPTDTVFTVGNGNTNYSGEPYVAYLFAHNDGDGEFGPDGDADIIKCGSYVGNSSSTGPEIDLGFEPQWIMTKNISDAGGWHMFDNMRGITTGGNDPVLYSNLSNAEDGGNNYLKLTSTGFQLESSSPVVNDTNKTYIYIAIRRGPMAVPESATDVFKATYGNATGEPAFTSNFPVDFGIWHGTISSANENRTSTRLTQGKTLDTDSTAAEQTSTTWAFDYQDGFMSGGGGSSNFATMWRRAPSFFDVVAYTGTDVYDSDIPHNLGVAPEMIWVKNRNRGDSAAFWAVYHKDLTATDYIKLNATDAAATSAGWWANTEPTATHFTIGNQASVNGTDTYIAYLFASLDGVSKVGSFSHTNGGGDTNVDCGFSSGARFVLLKRYSSTGGWVVLDTERGIIAGNDPWLALNSSSAQFTSDDVIDPYSLGFTVVSSFLATGDYIFYAIA